jgi:TRAP-type C4-dicarboxylate transport system permease large subunit
VASSTSHHSLSGGDVAGIVIGVLLGVSLIVLLIYIWYRHKAMATEKRVAHQASAEAFGMVSTSTYFDNKAENDNDFSNV